MESSKLTAIGARLLACALFASFASTSAGFAESPAAPTSGKKAEWRTDLNTALADAEKSGETVLLRFTATWCGPCRVMDARVWSDQTVQAGLAGKYILVKSDIDQEASKLLADRYGVRGVPTILLLDRKGKEIARSGFMSPPETVDFLRTPRRSPEG